ncbi:hypothetical protein BT63DRAFT_426428 [Microthyrium microscopicum]|uniref:Peptidase S33 tripeptidyl aminopeptidase-like C-terminal domain-containing protein n=1 Tax=Microthyrium microscopicum TaxID=703497 RepID=A0A6A6U9J5_9PEZI|nr:hypothetical protein BT63DRAFT_426428 [Microthyrium microscopicum]
MIQDWKDITSTPDLNWVPCFDNFTCTILQVPLDYTDLSIGNTTVPFIKFSSTNASAEDVLFNPGGPGASGIIAVKNGYKTILSVIGSRNNLVGFDPRGVNNSGLSLECFPNNLGAKIDFIIETLNRPIDDSSEAAIYDTYLKEMGWGERCTAHQDPKQPKQYANTVAVANDMRYYSELRAKSLGLPVETSKLWYYGTSYGTILGETYATLFPDRIGRMLLDGVVDSEEWYSGSFLGSLVHADAGMKTFFADCFAAGPAHCSFSGNSTSADDIERRFYTLFEQIQKRPLLADVALTATPVTVTWREIKYVFFEALYDPSLSFAGLADTLADLEQGNGTSLAMLSSQADLQLAYNNSQVVYADVLALSEIGCIDAAGRHNVSAFEDYLDYVHEQVNISWIGGGQWAVATAGACTRLDIKPPQSQLFQGTSGSNHTSVPILFLSNTLDPVAPIESARKESSRFAGSTVLTLNGTAHCGLQNPSVCQHQHTQKYMLDATLPPAGTVCGRTAIPFGSTT